jgi:cytochrome c-type biogenesis protein CcmH/NrfG
MSEEIVKVAVLEQKFADFVSIVNKLDDAIQKMSEVNTNVIKMLAVHDEKIEYQQRTDDLLLKMIDNLKEENEKEHKRVSERMTTLEDKVSEISKIKWMTVGCGILLAVLAAAFSTLASGWWTPSEMHQMREGRIPQQTQ